MQTLKILTFISLIFFLTYCKPSEKIKNTENWLQSKTNEYNPDFSLDYNQDSSFVILSSSNKQELIPNFKLKFSVLDVENKKVILQKEIDNSSVSWFSKTEILIIIQLGYEDKKTGKSQKHEIIDISTKEI